MVGKNKFGKTSKKDTFNLHTNITMYNYRKGDTFTVLF